MRCEAGERASWRESCTILFMLELLELLPGPILALLSVHERGQAVGERSI